MSKALKLSRAVRGRGVLSDLGPYRNKIINGDFDIWQRGEAFNGVVNGALAYCADRWRLNRNGSGATLNAVKWDHKASQPLFRNIIAVLQSVAGAGGTYSNLEQLVEGVRTLSGKKATLTFYARRPDGNPFSLPSPALQQNFGTGGSASVSIAPTVTASTPMGTSFVKVQRVFEIPSVFGKTIGANDALVVAISLPLNAVFNLEIAHVSLVEGDATEEDDPFSPRSIGQELALCQRYFVKNSILVATIDRYSGVSWPVSMRAVPTISGGGAGFTLVQMDQENMWAYQNSLAVQSISADAEL